MDVMLRGEERGVGMCTDVALYVLHAGARIIPFVPGGSPREYRRRCGPLTARLHLETLYPSFVSPDVGVLNLMMPNAEHLQLRDVELHARMHVWLCKTRFCTRWLRHHAAEAALRGRAVWFMGHSSSDPVEGSPGGLQPWRSATGDAWRSFLHVKVRWVQGAGV